MRNGEHVVIRELKNSIFKVKMMEMGLIKGKKIEVLFRAPFGGPIAIDVDGYTLSLRKDEATLVLVENQTDI
ncbi:MAG: ferrous iron transport protein A [Fluviicola sp.]|nr:ferrous iron transport protein A [Fluviicola sp.]